MIKVTVNRYSTYHCIEYLFPSFSFLWISCMLRAFYGTIDNQPAREIKRTLSFHEG